VEVLWSGICHDGRTHLKIVQGTLNAVKYRDDILDPIVLPYRVHPINVQLVSDPVIMPAKEEHGRDSGSECLDKHEPSAILHCHVERQDQMKDNN
jgi:hypothetical protein